MREHRALLEPISVGKRVFKNRMVMAPMETRMNTPYGDVTQPMIDYYAERAKGGAAAIIIENSYIDNEASRSSLSSSGFYSDHLISGKSLLAESIKENGALAIIQLSHGGRQAGEAATGKQCVAPSPIPCKVTQRLPKELSIREIQTIEDAFADAARRAQMAGFDGVELHGAHGYLMASFISPYSNKRTDEYGGSAENRARIAANVIKKVREKTGQDFIVGLRISGEEFVPGGFNIKQACEFVMIIEDGIDYIHISAGNYENSSEYMIMPMYEEAGKLLSLSEAMKKCVSIPVIAVGALDADLAEQAIKKGQADIAAFGRALIADPMLPNKVASGKLKDIRPCCRGNEGCISRFFLAVPMRCEVNPACGRERDYRIVKTTEPKRILIAGGGPAGLETARLASLMGHDVTLYEKTDKLGGHLVEGTVSNFKNKTATLLEWLKTQIKNSNVKIYLNTAVTAELIKKEQPDVLILAVGSTYQKPPILGYEKAIFPDDALLSPQNKDKTIIVIGGGLIGSETALTLAETGARVTIVEMLGDIVPEHEPFSQDSIKRRLAKANVQILTGHMVKEILDDGVVCRDSEGRQKRLAAQTVILATGLKPNTEEAEKLKGIVSDTYVIGDCKAARKIYNSFHEAWHTAMNL